MPKRLSSGWTPINACESDGEDSDDYAPSSNPRHGDTCPKLTEQVADTVTPTTGPLLRDFYAVKKQKLARDGAVSAGQHDSLTDSLQIINGSHQSAMMTPAWIDPFATNATTVNLSHNDNDMSENFTSLTCGVQTATGQRHDVDSHTSLQQDTERLLHRISTVKGQIALLISQVDEAKATTRSLETELSVLQNRLVDTAALDLPNDLCDDRYSRACSSGDGHCGGQAPQHCRSKSFTYDANASELMGLPYLRERVASLEAQVTAQRRAKNRAASGAGIRACERCSEAALKSMLVTVRAQAATMKRERDEARRELELLKTGMCDEEAEKT